MINEKKKCIGIKEFGVKYCKEVGGGEGGLRQRGGLVYVIFCDIKLLVLCCFILFIYFVFNFLFFDIVDVYVVVQIVL